MKKKFHSMFKVFWCSILKEDRYSEENLDDLSFAIWEKLFCRRGKSSRNSDIHENVSNLYLVNSIVFTSRQKDADFLQKLVETCVNFDNCVNLSEMKFVVLASSRFQREWQNSRPSRWCKSHNNAMIHILLPYFTFF